MKADERRARFGGRNGQIGAEATPAEFLDALLAGDVGEHLVRPPASAGGLYM